MPAMNDPDSYSVSSSPQRQTAERLIMDRFPRLTWTEEERVLDVGCGDGSVTAQLIYPRLPRGSLLIGVDISPEMVQFANTKYGSSNLIFRQLDITDTGTARSSFERFTKVVSFSTLHWANDYRVALETISCLLESKGTALICHVLKSPVSDAYQTLSASPRWCDVMEDAFKYRFRPLGDLDSAVETLERLLPSVGMKKVWSEIEWSNFHFTDAELYSYEKPVNPFVKRLPPDEASHLISDVVQELRRHSPITPDNLVSLSYPVLKFQLEKL